jgi:hypothetical protein
MRVVIGEWQAYHLFNQHERQQQQLKSLSCRALSRASGHSCCCAADALVPIDPTCAAPDTAFAAADLLGVQLGAALTSHCCMAAARASF